MGAFDLRTPEVIRYAILQAVDSLQGTGSYVDNVDIAKRVGIGVDEVEGHLSILEDEDRIEVARTMADCSAYLHPKHRQRFREMVPPEKERRPEDTRKVILSMLLSELPKGASLCFDSYVAQELDIPIDEAKGHLDILKDERRITFEITSRGYLLNLTHGDTLRIREYLHSTTKPQPTMTDSFEHSSQPVPNASIPVEITESLRRFQSDNPDPDRSAFIIMRFGSTPAHESIVRGIRKALEKHGIVGLRADDKEYHSDLWSNIRTYMHGCRFAIAVFERLEADEFNPNVALEVGYLNALGKHVCLLKDRTLRLLPTDIVGKLYRTFDNQAAEETIPEQLENWMRDKDII